VGPRIKWGGASIVLATVIAAILATGGPPDPPPVGEGATAAHLWIDDDGGTCTRDPEGDAAYSDGASCGTFEAAYIAATQGDIVGIMPKSGGYPTQMMDSSPKGNARADEADVLFLPAEGEAVYVIGLTVNVPHVEVRNFKLDDYSVNYRQSQSSVRGGDVTFRDMDLAAGDVTSAYGARFYGGEIGPNTDGHSDSLPWPQDTLQVNSYGEGHDPTDFVMDGVTLHDVTRPAAGSHSDCLQFTAMNGSIVRNSIFYNCADTNFIPKNDQGNGFQGVNIIENNMFAEVPNNSYGINFYDNDSRDCGTWIIRNNSLDDNLRFGAYTQETLPSDCDLTIVGNVHTGVNSTMCNTEESGVVGVADVYEYNVMESGVQCGATNYIVPDGNVGFVNRSWTSAFDLSLTAGSEAINRGHPTLGSTEDIFGTTRPLGVADDAGAHERE
jgi:hypothetical protein